MPEFKFKVGDYVRMKISARQSGSDRWGKHPHDEARGLVVERCYRECPDAKVISYWIRWATSGGAITRYLYEHNEIELVASEPFPPNHEQDKA